MIILEFLKVFLSFLFIVNLSMKEVSVVLFLYYRLLFIPLHLLNMIPLIILLL